MVILFIPRSGDCSVRSTWNSFADYKEETKILIEDGKRSLNEYLSFFFKEDERPQKKLVFAHGSKDGIGIMSLNNDMIDPVWWDHLPPFKIVVFHACHGARTLTTVTYKDTFQDWLSYSNKIYVLEGDAKKNKTIVSFWRDLFISMVKIVKASVSCAEVKSEFEWAYIDAVLRLNELRPGKHGEISKSLVMIAMKGLQTKY